MPSDFKASASIILKTAVELAEKIEADKNEEKIPAASRAIAGRPLMGKLHPAVDQTCRVALILSLARLSSPDLVLAPRRRSRQRHCLRAIRLAR
jgi:hypothetical protein